MPGQVRTRGGRRQGRGVRTRGGGRGGGNPPPVENPRALAVVVEPTISGRGRSSRGRTSRGRSGRGRSATTTSSTRTTRPVPVDEIRILDIHQLPVGAPLETPIVTNRKRKWSPPRSEPVEQDEQAAQQARSPARFEEPDEQAAQQARSPARFEEPDEQAAQQARSPARFEEPDEQAAERARSPARCTEPDLMPDLFTFIDTVPLQPSPSTSMVERDMSNLFGPSPAFTDSGSMAPSPVPIASTSGLSSRARYRQPLREEEIERELNNFGSEEDSDNCDEEESCWVLPIPLRTNLFDTPLDPEEVVEPEQIIEFGEVPAVGPAVEEVSGQSPSPDTIYDFQWSAFPETPVSPELRRKTFDNSNVGPTAPNGDPLATFLSIWDKPFMEYIASETNKYAQTLALQMLNTHTLHPSSRICDWKDTSAREIYTFFGILLAMGVVVKTRIEEYWSASFDVFITPGFSVYMSLRRFQLLSRCLHFNDNRDMSHIRDASEAKLFKIKPVITHLNQKFQSLYNMCQNIALDESLLLWKGWLQINQFNRNKAAGVGIKSYEVCESRTGYLWRFEIHAHKKNLPPSQPLRDPMLAPTPALVLRLIQGLENKGYTLWMDNYYNSPALARKLLSIGFDCVGTLRTNRQYVPQELKDLTKERMRVGQVVGYTSGDVDLMVWRDQNRVAMISTYHGNAVSSIHGQMKPNVVQDYNIMMGGVDKKDQMLAMYPMERKRTSVWYKKLFRRLLNISVLNSYILVRQSHPDSSMTHRNFRISLINSILSTFRPIPAPTPALGVGDSANMKDIRHHHLLEHPFPANGRSRRRPVCVVCRERTILYCVGCNKSMCLNPCFITKHGGTAPPPDPRRRKRGKNADVE